MTKLFAVHSVQRTVIGNRFVESFIGMPFLLYYDLGSGRMYIATDDDYDTNILKGANRGLALSESDHGSITIGDLDHLVVYFEGKEQEGVLDGIFDALGSFPVGIFIGFSPSDKDYIRNVREGVEKRMSSIETKSSISQGNPSSRSGESTHFDLYFGSDLRRIYSSILDMLNECILSTGSAYSVSIIVNNDCSGIAKKYLSSKLMVIGKEALRCKNIDKLFSHMRKVDALPFSYSRASSLITFPKSVKRLDAINTPGACSSGGIAIGEYLHDSISPSGDIVRVKGDALNLGTIVTGLPGTGKTLAVSSILDQISSKTMARMVIISPTEEWAQFASRHGMQAIDMAAPHLSMNFFKCPDDMDRAQFYENLAMLIASSCNSGPYESSIEKCLLAAFSRIYALTGNPDPADAYGVIEETLIEQHGKHTNAGVKYTKHGENVKVALENLRLMLMKPQFAYSDSVDFGSLLENGAVFDLSGISNASKPFFYAMILNQVYCVAESLDLYGDSSIRIVMCMEEAQLVFNREDDSAATIDLKQRLQNFRKKGIGLVLITHNVTDINPGIRRLLQNKLYFRQSSDVAKFAANDLIFDEESIPDAVTRLKLLEQRNCALSYVSETDGIKAVEKSIFVKVPEIAVAKAIAPRRDPENSRRIHMRLELTGKNGAIPAARISVMYLGETVARCSTDDHGIARVEGVLLGKRYRIIIHSEKRKDSREVVVQGQECAKIEI